MGNKNGAAKNLEKVTSELRAWGAELLSIAKRFRYVTVVGQASRVPLEEIVKGTPDNNEVLHLLTAVISSTYQSLPRTLTYLTIIGGLYAAVSSVL